MEQQSLYPNPPYWYTEDELSIPKIPEEVKLFGQVVNTEYKEIKLEDFGISTRYENGTKSELKELLQQLYQVILELFQNLSYDNIYTKQNAQEMLLILQNMHHLINNKFVMFKAKRDVLQLQLFMKQRIEEYENIFKHYIGT
eukprot:NODE_306_length_11344_cov_0.675767.p8 type:complete len:142 gc:universal NODE_306_length_11344_cov_0.675767:10695-11120(+)